MAVLPPEGGEAYLDALVLRWCERLAALPPGGGEAYLDALVLRGGRRLAALPPEGGEAYLDALVLRGGERLAALPPEAIFFSDLGKEYGKKSKPKGENTIFSPFGIPHSSNNLYRHMPGHVFADYRGKESVRFLQLGKNIRPGGAVKLHTGGGKPAGE